VASASTVTARSFRELHRKSSTQFAKAKASASAATLTIPSDEDSDAAISFSEGRRTPLPPPIEGEPEEERDHENGEEYLNPTTSAGEQARFFTPEPPASPGPETSPGQDEEEEGTLRGCERLQGSALQAVSA
jgi:hypothetical protein